MKVFHTVLDDFIALQPRCTAPDPTSLARAPVADLNIVTFPGILKPLQPIWSTFGTITAKAVKSDDAKIDTMMWDSRVTLVLPISSRVLNRLRACIMGHWAKLAYKSFRRYLLIRYGSTWVSQLLQSHRDHVTAARFELQWSTDYHNGPPAKRQKRSHCRGRNHKVSVCSPPEDRKSSEPAAKRLRGGVCCPPSVSIPATSLSELVVHTDAGVNILSQVPGGTWWEWVNGSGLFFWRRPEGQQMKAARDGMNIFVRDVLPTNKRAMQSPPTKKLEKIAKKVGQTSLISLMYQKERTFA